MTASETWIAPAAVASAAKPRCTSGRTAKSSPSMPSADSMSRSASTSSPLSGVDVIATRSGSPSPDA